MEDTERGREELLDYLAARSGCAYLSDLRIPSAAARLEQVLRKAPWGHMARGGVAGGRQLYHRRGQRSR